jgi:hypothetical protein
MPKKNDYKTFEPGTYGVTRLEFFTKDDSGTPIYVTQETRIGPRLIARYHTFDGMDDEMPPGSVSPEDIPLLVYAFGADPSQLPDDPLQALSVAEKLIADADKEVDVIVTERSNGWISWVRGMNLPEGEYLFSFDGSGEWYVTEYGVFANARLSIVSMADGSSTPFAKCVTTLRLKKEPWAVLRALSPSTTDAMMGSEEEELTRLAEMATQENDNRLIFGEVGVPPNAKRPKVLAFTLRPVEKGQVVTSTGDTDFGEEPSFIELLYQAIAEGVEKQEDGKKAFTKSGGLSAAGKAYCGRHLRPIATANKITTKFADMTEDVVKIYLKELGRFDLLAKLCGTSDEDDGDFG